MDAIEDFFTGTFKPLFEGPFWWWANLFSENGECKS